MDHDDIGAETEAVEDVFLSQMASGEKTSVQHFRIEPGAVVPSHDHPHEQAGFIYQGEGTFILENGEEITLGPGESYVLEGNEVHSVENRGDEPFLGVDIFSPPRTNPDWGDE